MVGRLMSTRARAKLWKLQEAVRAAAKDRDRFMRQLEHSRVALSPSARQDLLMEFQLAEQEYRCAVAALASFCELHTIQTATETFEGSA